MVSIVPHHVFQIQLQRHFVSISSSSSHLVKLVNFKHVRKDGVCLFKGPRTHDVSAFASPLDRPYSFTSDPKKLESDGKFPKEPPDQLLFDFYKNEDHLVPINKFIAALRHYGLRKSDPRLAEFMKFLRDHHRKNEDTGSPEMLYLDEETFKRAVGPNVSLISKCLFEEFIIPDFKCFTKHIEEFYYLCEPNSSGKVADYIPQLARADPKSWGVSVCTVDGQRYSIGKTNTPFTIQSCSKPLTYGIALEELTEAEVHQYVGQEPSGRNFNELILDHNKKPHNPMINAGAIVVCSLLKTLIKPEMTPSEKFDYIMNYFKRLAGGEHIGFNNAIFLSEKVSADRNYALGFYMREHKCYPDNTNMKEVMDFYFQCCSMEATCESSSVIAATLANGGICPITEEKVLRPESVRDVLSLMHSCGMYDYSGQFAFKVGLPAKSGVSGTMLIVVPNTMGIALWSPPLDPLGNSCRGVQFCEELVKTFNFHKYDNLRHASNKIDPRRHRFSSIGYSIVTLLFNAAAGNLTALRRFKVSGLDMSLSDYDGRTALHLAAAEGHEECVQFLIECGVDIDVKDR
uniref:glutaminase n=1 Tax=Cacopsylla melanoneura TaxID=428564 RepID=A0A8D9F7G9_9HEMI